MYTNEFAYYIYPVFTLIGVDIRVPFPTNMYACVTKFHFYVELMTGYCNVEHTEIASTSSKQVHRASQKEEEKLIRI